MLGRLLLLFTVLPLVELYLLIRLGRATSSGTAIAVVIGTGLLGAALARREGLRVWAEVRRRLAAGQMPADALIDALLILVAGTMLITPGLLTDAAGLLLLLPPTRAMVRTRLKRWFGARFVVVEFLNAGIRPLRDDDVIDVQATEVRDADERL